jgi:RimJ/RimL family protein N-acetyltransferase
MMTASLRLLTPADAGVVGRGLELLGPRSRYRRWGVQVICPETALAWITELDGIRRVAVGACSADGPIGVARYVGAQDGTAEIAATVIDSAQGQGFGGLLLDELVSHARRNGFEVLRASIQLDNHAAIRLMRGIGGQRLGWSDGVLEYEARIR